MTAVPWKLTIAAAALEAAWIALRLLSPLRSSVWSAIAILVGTSVVYLIAVHSILKLSQPATPGVFNNIHRWILAAAIVFRITAFTLPTEFTDDLYRYRWEARLQAAGGNPYLVAPNDPAWAHLRDETFEHVSGRDFRAVYGPLTELVYYRVALPLDNWKLPAALADLGVMGALWLLLPTLGFAKERILVYAWCPVPVFEFWANGHNDSLMLCPLVLAFWAHARGGRWSAFSFLALAASAKIWPVALAPLFGLGIEMLAMIPVLAVFLAPYGFALISNGPFLSGFLGGWRNNDSLYGLLLWLTGGQYPAKYAAFAIVAATVGWVSWRRYAPTAGALAVASVMLLVSSNCHPWYLSWLLPMLAAHPVRALFVWIALSPLFYSVLPRWFDAGEWNGSTWVRWLVYVPAFAVFIWDGGLRLWYSKKSPLRVLTSTSPQ